MISTGTPHATDTEATRGDALDAVLRIQDLIARRVPAQRVLRELCSEAVALTGADAAGIVIAHEGVGNRAFEAGSEAGHTLITTAHPSDLSDLGHRVSRRRFNPPAPFVLETSEGPTTWSVLGTPVLADARAIGGMLVFSPEGAPLLDPTHADVMRVLAGQAGIALTDASRARHVHQAFHDPVTGLPNRPLFLDRLDHALIAGERRKTPTALLVMDLDRFGEVNDAYGHGAGDEALRNVAEAMTSGDRAADSVARTGGDRFAVLLEGTDAQTAYVAAERILRAVGQIETLSMASEGRAASIGLAVAGPGECSLEALMHRADLAMSEVKRGRSGGVRAYEPRMGGPRIDPATIQGDLQRCLDRDELRVHYQPIVSLQTQNIVGVEALVRWDHPIHGLLPPDEFIPSAEANGLIIPLGRRVLEISVAQVAQWRERFASAERLSLNVNVSGHQLKSGRLATDITRCLRESGLPADALALEVTESIFLGDDESIGEKLAALRALGAKLCIDDYGTGFSSLRYIQVFPFDVLKIDKGFVRGLSEDHTGAPLVQSMMALAENLGMSVVAEGIENSLELAQLRAMRCERGQGFHFARPLDSRALSELLEGDGRLIPGA